MKKKVYIVEDMAISRAALIDMLIDNGYAIAGSAAHADKAWLEMKEVEFDIALLDINLAGELDGIWIAQMIREHKNRPIIYLTAYGDDKTLEKLSATKPNGYLMKPYNAPTLLTTMTIALGSFAQQEEAARLKQIETPHIFVKDGSANVKIELHKITFIKSEGNYIEIHQQYFKNTVRDKLVAFAENLPKDVFVQIHRRYIVNREYIDSFSKSSLTIGSHSIPISKSYKDNLSSPDL